MKTTYLPHIDILRALAVLLVIFHHLEFSYFKGGFIGVDVFLVISGFLITRAISQERQTTTCFSFKDFYQRRIIRLAPAFFTVIFSSSIVFYSILTEGEWKEFLKTAVASVTLTSNIYYYTLLNDYFSISARSTPLLHIWSLSLEEQFYLVWPVFFLFLLNIKGKSRLIVLIFITLLSLVVSYISALKDPIGAYYLLPSRIFEFCIGALITLLPPKKFSPQISTLMAIASLTLIIVSSLLITRNSLFPSYTALAPCLGAALFIYGAHGFAGKFFQPIQYIGKISYPMYLWHWPIIVYLSLLSVPLTSLTSIAVIVLTIAFSGLTYELIEKKIKLYFLYRHKPIQTLFALPSLIIVLAFGVNNFSILQNAKQATALPSQVIDDFNQIKCIDQSNHPHSDCFLGETNKEKIDFLLVGDSHANAQRGFVDYLAKNAKLKGYEVTFSSTAYLPGMNRSVRNMQTGEIQVNQNFYQINSSNQTLIKNNKFRFVIMGGFFPHNWERNIYSLAEDGSLEEKNSKQNFILGLEKAIKAIAQTGAAPVLINDNPILVDVDINCNLRKDFVKDDCTFDKVKYDADFAEWLDILNKVQQRYPELIVLDLNRIICDSVKCYSSLNGIPLYRDSQHLTYAGSKEIAIEYLKRYDNPFK
ncbi:acyltransferase family protein [Alkanindiges sp. WGS2144]|uniref:acyltransferase family protein n=1 Tax=Alkanindiges sp. WGS2144 TaxID=3366808 RepID=UPI0037501638